MLELNLLFSAGLIGVLFFIVSVFIILTQQISEPNKELREKVSKLEEEIRLLDSN